MAYFWSNRALLNSTSAPLVQGKKSTASGFSARKEEGSSGTGNTSRFPLWEALLVCHGFTVENRMQSANTTQHNSLQMTSNNLITLTSIYVHLLRATWNVNSCGLCLALYCLVWGPKKQIHCITRQTQNTEFYL